MIGKAFRYRRPDGGEQPAKAREQPDAALPYPLAGAPAAISGPFERGTPLVAADADDAAKLRALRAQYQATPPFTLAPQYSIPVVLSASNGSECYDLSLRDTVPFEVDGALAIEEFIQ